MFNPLSCLAVPFVQLAKASRFSPQTKRLLSQNLTVLVCLIYFVRCIVFKDRAFRKCLFSLNAGFIIAKDPPIVNPFFGFFCIFLIFPYIVVLIYDTILYIVVFTPSITLFLTDSFVKKNVF